jgi:creatinase
MNLDARPRTLKISNGIPPLPTFSLEEMNRRLTLLRGHMQETGINAVLFTSMHNINYYADFIYCAFGRNYGCVITSDQLTTISANIDGGQPGRQTFGHNNVVYTDWHQDNFFYAAAQLLAKARVVAIEFDHVTLQNKKKLEAALPGVNFVDIGEATMLMRMRKSQEELDLIREGARICDVGGHALVAAIREGAHEYQVARAATQAMVDAIAGSFPHTELMDTWTWFQSGINTDGAHNPLTTRQIENGDILSLNCFSMISGYYQALERTLFLDHCDDEHLRLWQINCEVHRRGLDLIGPGMRCSAIANELNEIYREHDLLQYRTFGYGHSFGTLSHYYGREAGLELREDIDTILAPGMVVSIEPMIMLPESQAGSGGYREHDILIVTEDGAENITRFPFGPENNIV